jgi:subtilisin family serine protease
MKQLFRILIASLVVCLAVPLGAGAAQSDPLHKEGRGKLSYELDRIARESERGGQVKSMSPAYNRAKGTVTVVIELNAGASTDAIQSVVRAAGGRVDGVAANLVKATMAPGVLRDVAAQPDVRLVRAPYRPTVKKAGRVGAARSGAARLDGVVSQGVGVIGADSFRARTGADGSGITVGVLDGAFEGVEGLIGSELPEDIGGTEFVLSHLDSPGTHGTACAEVVHDVAPGARIVLGAFDDEVVWANQIDELINSGARIISHSIGFDNIFPPDGNNYFTQKVDAGVARGVLFVTAAGNEGENYYQGRWTDVNHDGFLEFVGGGAVTEMLPVAIGGGATVRLRWDDPYGHSNHDYDIALVTSDFAQNPDFSESNPAVLAMSADAQLGAGDPVETINVDLPEPVLLYLVVRHDPASPESATQRMFVWNRQGIVDPTFVNASGSLSLPADARGAVTVGAMNWESRGLEGFSSRGPTADNRVKPDVVGPDAVDTASLGAGAFTGTSAATPHVAGAAALLLSRNPSLSATALRQALERATTSNGSATAKNNDVGFGLIDLTRAP